jgi:hypothetical protein
MIPDHLRIQPGQQTLTPAQEAEARRFAEERIAAQLSTEPVDESEAERLLRQAYEVAGLRSPQHIFWLDGPLQLVVVRAPQYERASMEALVGAGVYDRVRAKVRASVPGNVYKSLQRMSMFPSVHTRVHNSVSASVHKSVGKNVLDSVYTSVFVSVYTSIHTSIHTSVDTSVYNRVIGSVRYSLPISIHYSVRDSVWASYTAHEFAFFHFFDVYLAPHALHALAHFIELVSGYWLGQEVALLVRRPTVLARDSAGRLHSPSGKCLAYPDGWGFYAWHGLRVPERVIRKPERLTREDFFKEPNVEVRRVIQERMGSRFVSELGGQVIDTGARGTLYEVRLPEGDPEGVARYVQVQDASTPRQYVLRVPPTIQTAAEAVAWSFQVGLEDYHPAQET